MMRSSRCPLAATGALVVLALLLPSSATADVFGSLDPAVLQSGAAVTTDKADYEPGAPVVLTGSGWQVGESIDIVVNDDGLQSEVWQHTATVVADDAGGFVYQFDLPPWLVANYTLTATGASSGSAFAAFTDSHVERGCDVAATLVVNTTDDDFSATDDGICSLREAIVTSNAHPEVTDITVPGDASPYTLTIPKDSGNDDGEDGDLDVFSDVSINGDGPAETIIEAGTTPGAGIADRVFHVRTAQGIDLDLNDLTVRHGFPNTAGGGIRVENGTQDNPSTLDLMNVVVTLNRMTSGNGGAGIYIVNGNAETTVTDSDIVFNDTAANCTGCDAGAIFNRGRSLAIENSHLDDNSAGAKAGALWNNNGGQVTINDSTLNNNTNNNAGADDLDGFGGAIYQADSDSLMTITNSEVNGNTSQGRGGGIYNQNGRILINRSEVNDNTLDGPRDGGGIHNVSNLENPAAIRIIDSTVARNVTGRNGGGYFDDGSLNESLFVSRSTFNDNDATGNGGGFHTKSDATIANSTIDNNHAGAEGGGIWMIDRDVRLYNVTVSDNDAGTLGDGLRRNNAAGNDGDFFLSNTIVANNDCSAEVNASNPIGAAFNNVTNNLDTGTSCGFGAANGSLSNADPELGPLQDNGGPTFTRAIGGTSDALDAGNNTVCAAAPVDGIDQRHVPRPQGAACDIGAYERAATIAGMKFNDLNMDGIKDGGEPGLEGWVINAYNDDGGGTLDGSETIAATDETDANGNYKLALGAGDYVVCEELQNGWTQSLPDPAGAECDAVAGAGDGGYAEPDLSVGDDLVGRDFGNFESQATISGVKYDDENEDGINDTDPDDPGLEGWVIEAYVDENGNDVLDNGEENGPPAATDTTDSDGAYELTVAAGVYIVCEQLQADWAQSEPSNTACANVPGAADGGHVFAIAAGETEPNRDFGNYAGLVKGTKTDDADGSPLEGWTICAYEDDGDGSLGDPEVEPPVACDETGADGVYTLGLQAGDYVICEELQAGWTQVTPANTKCQEIGAPTAEGGHAVLDLLTTEERLANDFANESEDTATTISGIKFDDENEDGVNDADPDDPGLAGWVINAYADTDASGTFTGTEATDAPAFSETTDANGEYEMTVDPGSYIVCEELQANWAQSHPSTGADCAPVDGAGPLGYAFTLAEGDDETADFGNYAGLVSGMKFDDVAEDGVKDVTDPPLAGWVINAYADTDGNGILDNGEETADPVASATTAADGTYTLGLQDGDYVICEELQTGWLQSFPAAGTGDCSLVAGAGPEGYFLDDFDTMDEAPDTDFGNFEGATISGMKFDDQNRDGVKDVGEPGLEGWTIEAYNDYTSDAITPLVASAVTDADGNYTLTVPADGLTTYVVCEQLQTGWVQSAPAPGDGNCDQPPVTGTGPDGYVTDLLNVGDEVTGFDFGNYRTATVTVNKTYSDGTTTTAVTVELECTGGDVDPATDTASPGSPAEFDVDGFSADDTCDVTEVTNVSGFTADTSDCQNLDLEAGAQLECTIVNVEDTTIVTQGGCTFDRETDRAGNQFPLIFTPDTGSYYKLSSSNPGSFFLNVVYEADAAGEDIKIKIPFPFVPAGAVPIKVHEDVTVQQNGAGKTCFQPNGTLLSSETDQWTWNYTTTADFGQTKEITVTAPEAGLVYVRIHLAYGLKGLVGGCTKGAAAPRSPANACTKPRTGFDVGGAPSADGYEQYPFTFMGTGDSGGGSVESFNEFKKNPGIGSLALKAPSGDAVPFTTIEYWQGSKKLGAQATDEDGWSMWLYKYTGKATTFTVKLPAYGLSQSVTMKSNGYVSVGFSVPEGTTTPTLTPEPTPTPTPTKPGGKK